MAKGYEAKEISDIDVNEKNSAFVVGDAVKVTKQDKLPDFAGTIEKKYTNSALIAFNRNENVPEEVIDDLNGHYIVNYDHLSLVTPRKETKATKKVSEKADESDTEAK